MRAAKKLTRANKSQGQKHERDLEKVLGIAANRGSGCGPYKTGDLVDHTWYVEAKSTRACSLRFAQAWWTQAANQAGLRDIPEVVVALRFAARPSQYTGALDFFVYNKLPDGVFVWGQRTSEAKTVTFSLPVLTNVRPGSCLAIQGHGRRLYVLHTKDFLTALEATRNE